MPFLASPTFSMLYKKTVESFPQAFLLLVIGSYLLIAILTIVVRWVEGKAEKVRIPEEENGIIKT